MDQRDLENPALAHGRQKTWQELETYGIFPNVAGPSTTSPTSSPRTLWKDNPLGKKGEFTSDGRKWKTDCDTPQTGRNGCRSYILASVIKATPKGGGKYTYTVTNEWVFNNIVKFS